MTSAIRMRGAGLQHYRSRADSDILWMKPSRVSGNRMAGGIVDFIESHVRRFLDNGPRCILKAYRIQEDAEVIAPK